MRRASGRWLLIAVLLLLLAAVGWTAYRHLRQARLDNALLVAVASGDAPRAERLLVHGADPNALVPREAIPPWKLALARITRQYIEEQPRSRALVTAAQRGDAATADVLLRYGAKTGLPGGDYFSPLCAAVSGDETPERVRTVSLLLRCGANPNGMECVGPAVDRAHLNTLRMLLDAGADPNGGQAMARVAHAGWAEGTRELLRRGADPTRQVNLFGVRGTPASYARSPAIRRLLLEAEADWRRKHRAANAQGRG